MIKGQNVLVPIDLVKLYVKRCEQVQHVVLVKAHLLKSAEFKLDTLHEQFVFELLQRDAHL